MGQNYDFQEHHENVPEFFTASGRTAFHKTAFAKKKKKANPVTVKTLTAAAAVAVTASVVMAIYVRCAPVEIGKSYADIQIKTLNATTTSDIEYYLVKGNDKVTKDNFDEYLDNAFITEKGDLDPNATSLEFERLLAKTGYQLIFTYQDEEGKENLAGTYNFTTGPVESRVANKINNAIDRIRDRHHRPKDDDDKPAISRPEEKPPESSEPPVVESEIIPPPVPSESVPEELPPPPPQPSESVPEAVPSESVPEHRPRPPKDDGVSVGAPDYTASENSALSGIEFTIKYPYTAKNADTVFTGGDIEISYTDSTQNVYDSIPASAFQKQGDGYVLTTSGVVKNANDAMTVGVTARYTENGTEKTAPKAVFEAHPAHFKEPMGDYPVGNDTAGTISNFNWYNIDGVISVDYDINIKNIVNPKKPADTYFQIDEINLTMENTHDFNDIFEFTATKENLPNGGKVTGSSYSFSAKKAGQDLNIHDNTEYYIYGYATGSWAVKSPSGAYTEVLSSYLRIDPPKDKPSVVIGSPDVSVMMNPSPAHSDGDAVIAKITGLSTTPGPGNDTNSQFYAQPGTTLYVKVDVTGSPTEEYYVDELVVENYNDTSTTFTMVPDTPSRVPAGQTIEMVYEFTLPKAGAEIQLRSLTVHKTNSTFTANTAPAVNGSGEAKITGLSDAQTGPFGPTVKAPLPEDAGNTDLFAEVTVRNNGEAPMNVTALNLGGAQAAGFTVAAGKTVPFEVAPGASETIVYKFTAPAVDDTISIKDFTTANMITLAADTNPVISAVNGVTADVVGLSLDPAGTYNTAIEFYPSANTPVYAKVAVNNADSVPCDVSELVLNLNSASGTAFNVHAGKALPLYILPGSAETIVYKFTSPTAPDTLSIKTFTAAQAAKVTVTSDNTPLEQDGCKYTILGVTADTAPADTFAAAAAAYRNEPVRLKVEIDNSLNNRTIEVNGFTFKYGGKEITCTEESNNLPLTLDAAAPAQQVIYTFNMPVSDGTIAIKAANAKAKAKVNDINTWSLYGEGAGMLTPFESTVADFSLRNVKFTPNYTLDGAYYFDIPKNAQSFNVVAKGVVNAAAPGNDTMNGPPETVPGTYKIGVFDLDETSGRYTQLGSYKTITFKHNAQNRTTSASFEVTIPITPEGLKTLCFALKYTP